MIELETLLTSIATSVQNSQAAIQLNAYKHFMKYFAASPRNVNTEFGEIKSSKTYFPITQYFNVSDSPANQGIAVPAIALINHDSLLLESVKIELNVNGTFDGERFMVSTDSVNNAKGTQPHQITLDFKQNEPSERMEKLISLSASAMDPTATNNS